MKFLKIASVALLLAAAGTPARSQTTILSGINDFSSGKLLTITANRNVGGYIFVYKLHDKDTTQHLRIFDENLQKVGEASISTGKKSIVRQVIYESGHLLLTVYDPVDRIGYTEALKVLDLENSATASYAYMPSEKPESRYTPRLYPMGEYTAVPSGGFVGTYDQNSAGESGAMSVMIAHSGKLLWKKRVDEPGAKLSYVSLIGATRNAILYLVTAKKRLMSSDAKNYLVALNPATGEQLFRKPLEVAGEAWQPLFVNPVSDDSALLCSQLSDADDNLFNARQTGFNWGVIDLKTGAISDLRSVHYATDLGREVDMVNATKSKEGFMHLQNVLVFPDKSAVVVGEFFRRTVNGGGLALGIAGAMFGVVPTNMTQGTTGDLFLMRLNPSGKVTAVNRIEMRAERVSIPVGTSIAMLGRYLDGAGAFNYHHADEWDAATKTVVVVGKDNEGDKGLSTKAIHITPTGYDVKTLLSAAKMREEPTMVAKAKPGHVMLLKRNPKTKAVSLELMRTD